MVGRCVRSRRELEFWGLNGIGFVVVVGWVG